MGDQDDYDGLVGLTKSKDERTNNYGVVGKLEEKLILDPPPDA